MLFVECLEDQKLVGRLGWRVQGRHAVEVALRDLQGHQIAILAELERERRLLARRPLDEPNVADRVLMVGEVGPGSDVAVHARC